MGVFGGSISEFRYDKTAGFAGQAFGAGGFLGFAALGLVCPVRRGGVHPGRAFVQKMQREWTMDN